MLTQTKLFCSCSTQFGAPPNSQTCPTCLGLPGALPVLNGEAVTKALRAALALGCRINEVSTFARKHYFYPDLPKGYQITQHNRPLAEDGKVDMGSRQVIIRRLHIEEDVGKSIHTADSTLVDYNRSGIPLAEIVTTPCLETPAQARKFLEVLKQIIEYTGISDCKMEEGSLRCDANISLQKPGSVGTRTEIKNLNSFRAVEQALEYEIHRQSQLLGRCEKVLSQTLHWDEVARQTVPMRSKEGGGYRYLPEPDLLPLHLDELAIQQAVAALPELPRAKKARFIKHFDLVEADADILTRTRTMADYFEETVAAGAKPQKAANWLVGEVTRLQKGIQSGDIPFAPTDLAHLLDLNQQGIISGTATKEVLAEMFASGGSPEQIISSLGLDQVSSKEELRTVVRKVLNQQADAVRDYREGKERVLEFLLGQAMKQSGGKANPKVLKDLLLEDLRV